MKLYTYSELHFDPVKCARNLFVESKGDINKWITRYSESPNDYEAELLIVSTVRRVFNLPDYHGESATGYTDQFALDLLTNFNEFLEKKA